MRDATIKGGEQDDEEANEGEQNERGKMRRNIMTETTFDYSNFKF